MQDRRKFPRYQAGGLIKINLNKDGQELKGNLMNISEGGVQFFSKESFTPHNPYFFDVDLEEHFHISCEGIIAYVLPVIMSLGEGYLVGVQFQNMDSDTFIKIKTYIEILIERYESKNV